MNNRNSSGSRDQLQNSNRDREGRKMQPGMQGNSGNQQNSQGRSQTQHPGSRRQSTDAEELDKSVRGSVGSRQTGSSSEDRAGVADLDNDMKR
jgi:hypothetical protein